MIALARRSSTAFSIAWLVLLAACDGSTDSGATSGTAGAGAAGTAGTSGGTSLPCDVEALTENRCLQCHSATPQFGALMPLVTREDWLAPAKTDPAKRVVDLAITRMKDDKTPMPQAPNPRATDGEIAAVEAWVAAGTPARTASDSCGNGGTSGSAGTGGTGGASGASGTAGSNGTAGSAGSTTLSCTPDMTVKAPAPYAMPKDTVDEYRCVGIEVPNGADKKHITAIAPAIDNTTIVHHMLLFQAPDAYSPDSMNCGDNIFPPEWKMLYGWAPGAPALELPEAAGFAIEANATTHFVLQIHYSNIAQHEGLTDNTGLSLCTTTQLRPNDADVLVLGSLDINIPPHGTQTLSCDTTIPAQLTAIADLPLHVFQAFPHMHQLGTVNKTTITPKNAPAGSDPIDLGTSDPWNFFLQLSYPLQVEVNAGDKIHQVCAYNNPGDTTVTYGERTLDEMCFNFLSYYPKITYDQWSSLAPTQLSECTSSP